MFHKKFYSNHQILMEWFENYHKMLLTYIWLTRPLEWGFGIWIRLSLIYFGVVTHFGYTLLGNTWTSVIMIGVVGELLQANKKPLIYRGAYCLSCGEYWNWTSATKL